jgi:DnaK suppressor protein
MASAATTNSVNQQLQRHSSSRPRGHNAQVERALVAQREELARRLSARLRDVAVEREPDDEGALATSNYASDLALMTMNRERRELDEVNAALRRLSAGEYGICEVCESQIGPARLRALPWARLCIRCAERRPV